MTKSTCSRTTRSKSSLWPKTTGGIGEAELIVTREPAEPGKPAVRIVLPTDLGNAAGKTKIESTTALDLSKFLLADGEKVTYQVRVTEFRADGSMSTSVASQPAAQSATGSSTNTMSAIFIKARFAQSAAPRSIRMWLLIVAVVACASIGEAQDAPVSDSPYAPLPVFDALSTKEWHAINKCVGQGLAWLATKVEPQGGMPTAMGGQPAMTSLTTMAFLSRGHQPGVGPYGRVIDRMLDYALAKQKPDGLFLTETTPTRPARHIMVRTPQSTIMRLRA